MKTVEKSAERMKETYLTGCGLTRGGGNNAWRLNEVLLTLPTVQAIISQQTFSTVAVIEQLDQCLINCLDFSVGVASASCRPAMNTTKEHVSVSVHAASIQNKHNT